MEPPPSSSSQPAPPQSTDTPPPQQAPQQQPPPCSLPPSSLSSSSSSIPNPNPNPNSANIIPALPQQQNRPQQQQFNRPWSQSSQFSHFPPQFQASLSSTGSSPSSAPIQRGGIAIGVPAAAPPAVSSQPTSFSPSFVGSQYVGIPRGNPINVPDPNVPSSASNAASNFQGHGILRGSSVAPPSSSTPSTSQGQPSPHQPWLSSAPHGRPPLPSQSFRPQGNSQSLQQRSHMPQQSPQPIPAASQPQQLSSSQPQQQPFTTSNQSQENPGQQLSSRASQPPANQQQIARGQGIGSQRPPSPAVVQASITQSNPTDQPGAAEPVESCNRILSKRNIQELVNQIDASEKLDPEVEDVLVDIAEDFVDSVTTFGCLLAKHRKSNTLEGKDILLHLERAWNMTLPGFSGDEIKTYKKPVINDLHRERLAVVKKSIAAGEVVNNKSSGGPASGNAKGSLAKATPHVIGS